MWIQYVNKKTLGSILFAGAVLSAPTRRVDVDHIGIYSFKLEFQTETGEFVDAGSFKSVVGLDSEVEVIEYQDGEDPILKKRPGRSKFGNITLKKGYLPSPLLYQWRRAILSGEVAKKAGRLTLVDDAGEEIMHYNFFEAWPSAWRGLKVASLDGKGNDVLTEEVVIAIEYFDEAK